MVAGSNPVTPTSLNVVLDGETTRSGPWCMGLLLFVGSSVTRLVANSVGRWSARLVAWGEMRFVTVHPVGRDGIIAVHVGVRRLLDRGMTQ